MRYATQSIGCAPFVESPVSIRLVDTVCLVLLVVDRAAVLRRSQRLINADAGDYVGFASMDDMWSLRQLHSVMWPKVD